jgi:cytosine/adenosine deaminase-related metal-dependent hydrolase
MPRKPTSKDGDAALRPWPADTVERWKLDRIKPYERNARLHSDEQVAQIAESMRRFGVTAPVLVDEEGVLPVRDCIMHSVRLSSRSCPIMIRSR